MWNPSPDSRTGRLFANRTFLLSFWALFLVTSVALTVSTFSSAHPYRRDPNDYHLLNEALGPWVWPLVAGLSVLMLIVTARADQSRLLQVSHGVFRGQSRAATRARLRLFAAVAVAVFLVAWAISAVVGDDTTHVRQAIGAAAILVGMVAIVSLSGGSGGVAANAGPSRGGGLAG